MHYADHWSLVFLRGACFFIAYRTNNFVLFGLHRARTTKLLFLFTEMASYNALNEQQQLYTGQYFATWESAIAYVQKWCNTQGFKTRFNRSERNAEGEYRKLTIVCQHAGKYRSPLTELQA